MRIGVLAGQDCLHEHIEAIAEYGLAPVEIRTVGDLDTGLHGLIISGEDSPGFKRLLKEAGLLQRIKEMAENSLVIYGIDEGAHILRQLDLMNISTERKSERSKDSREATLAIPALGEKPVTVRFTGHPPAITKVGPNVGIICASNDDVVMARQGNFLVSTFKPGCNQDRRVYEYFFKMVRDASEPSQNDKKAK